MTEAIPRTFESIWSGSIIVIESPAEWWNEKQQSWFSVSFIRFFIIGTPSSCMGVVSTAYPLSLTSEALMAVRYLLAMSVRTGSPFPDRPNPRSCVLPRSDSKATTCLSASCLWRCAYWKAPLLGWPDSSPDQATNLRVRLGLSPAPFISRSASNTVMNPPPSSLAPVCDPVSQESMCPPISKIFSGQESPFISKTRLLELQLSWKAVLMFSDTTTFCLRSTIRSIIAASSIVIAAAGILGYPQSQMVQPVCTEEMLREAIERSSMALAPQRAHWEGPLMRIQREAQQLVQLQLKTTIFPATQSLRSARSDSLWRTTTSASTSPLTEQPRAVRSRAVLRGLVICRDSEWRIQRVKLVTGSRRTSSKPSFQAISRITSMTISSWAEPQSRGPQLSTMQASRQKALCL